MIYKQKDFMTEYNIITESAAILDECVYLTEDESTTPINTIPIIENTRIGKILVNFSDLENLVEDYGIDYIDAISSIAKENNIDPNSISVSMTEMQYLNNFDIVNEFNDVALTQSTSAEAISLLVETAVQIGLDEEEYSYIENIDSLILESELLLEILDTEEGRQKFLKAFNKRYAKNPKADKLLDKIDKLRTAIRLMHQDPNANPNEIQLREKELEKNQEKLVQIRGASTSNVNPNHQGHSRVFRRMADDEKLGLGGEENKEERIKLRKRAREIEDKKQRDIRRRSEEKKNAELNDTSFVKRVMARIKYSSPVQAISNAIKYLMGKLNKLRIAAAHTKEEDRSIFQKIILVVGNAINKLRSWLDKKTDANKIKSSSSNNSNDNHSISAPIAGLLGSPSPA